MSEQVSKPKVTKSFDCLEMGEEVKVMPLLATFIDYRRDIGLTEEELVKNSNLDRDIALSEVSMLEREGFVRSFICQQGTCGPLARRYRLVDGFNINLEISRPA